MMVGPRLLRLQSTLSRRLSTSAISQRSFTLSFKIAGSNNETETETYNSAKEFQEIFHGFRFTNPKTGRTFKPLSLPEQHEDPAVVYIAKHPFLVAHLENYDHNQFTDRAFEVKSCAALEQHLQPHSIRRRVPNVNPNREGAWRFLTTDKGNDMAEWEGIWEGADGHVFFLESKHLMDQVSFFCQFHGSVRVFIYIHIE
jgi:hypothetical protein